MNKPPILPKDKTLTDILFEIDNSPCHNSKFIEINKRHMVEIGFMNDFDYEIFWGCMNVYEVLGFNYFPQYADFRKGFYGDFSQGIEKWFYGKNDLGWTPTLDKFLELVEILRFFEIPSFCGIGFSEYEAACLNAAELYQTVTDDERQRRQVEKDAAIQQRVINYFNFDNYSEGELNHLARNLMENQKKSISINEALSAARFAPDNTYIVILKRNKVVCHVGKTEHPLSYIGLNHKKVGADSAYFDCIDPSYADDVIIELKVFYDLALDKIRSSLVNRKFATLKQAIFAYKTSDNISRKKILSAIESSKMRTIDLGNGHILIDKIALHKALYHPRSI